MMACVAGYPSQIRTWGGLGEDAHMGMGEDAHMGMGSLDLPRLR